MAKLKHRFEYQQLLLCLVWIIFHCEVVRPCDLSTIADASNTTYVSLKSCGLTSIDERQLARFTRLEILELQVNSLTVFPNVSAVGPTLKALLIARNDIGDFGPDVLDSLDKLEQLGLYSNELSVFPDLWPVSSTLKHLNLVANQITAISSNQLMPLQSLEELLLSRNPLVGFPHVPSALPKLSILELWSTSIPFLPPIAVENITIFDLKIHSTAIDLCSCSHAWLKKVKELGELTFDFIRCNGLKWGRLSYSDFVLNCDPQPSAFESGFATKMAVNMAVSNFNNYLLHSVFRETSLVKCFGQCKQIVGCVLFFWHPIERDCVVIAPTDDPVSVPDGHHQVWSYYAVN